MESPLHTISLRPRIQSSEDCLRPTRAEVDLSAIAHNYHEVKRASPGARVLAVVKADAYGHGVVPVAMRLQAEGASGFGVALAEEGLELREAGITANVLVLNGVYGGAHAAVLRAGLSPVVYDMTDIEAFHRAARGRRFAVHLKIDTGMARLGVPHDALIDFLDALARRPAARIVGLMTHLAAADSDDELTSLQLRRFRRALELVHAYGHRPQLLHAANSAALFRHADARFSMVRPGLALFGYKPANGVSATLRPAMRLRTQIIALRDVPKGASVGYGGTYHVERASRIATVPLGYADGLLRSYGPNGAMLVGGRRCRIVGPISMDLTMLDVTDAPNAQVGDEVVVLGAQDTAILGADDIAAASGTIPYEVLTNVSRRVPRFYV